MTSNLTVPQEFLAYIRKIASDLRSSQATLAMLAKGNPGVSGLTGFEYILINDTAINISRIADDLFAKCKSNQDSSCVSTANILLSLSISEIVNKKRAEYKQIKFNYPELSIGGASFAFAKINLKDFDFLLSSVIDRAVKASDNKGEIDINIGSNISNNTAWLTITDYAGKILSEEIKNIHLAFDTETSNRALEIAQEYTVSIFISNISPPDQKTIVQLSFNIIDCPEWMANNITVHKGDTVVVLSDNASINNEWESCFKKENIFVEHFTSKEEAIAFIHSFPQKEHLFFLVDFDLINKDLNGLHVLWQTLIPGQTVLMTGNYNDQSILDFTSKAGVRVLPKQLISKIPCTIFESEKASIVPIKADVVVIDDNKPFADTLVRYIKSKNLTAQTYYNPYNFLKDFPRYTKEIKIIIDNNLGANITGLEISEQLSAAGYNDIYLITGQDFAKGEIPDYITLIPKGNMNALDRVFEKLK